MRLLILNAGSSNLKHSVIDAVDERLWLQDQTAGQQSIRTIVGDIRSRLVGAGGRSRWAASTRLFSPVA
jgi:hypothetical protein